MENLRFQNGLPVVETSAKMWAEVTKANIRLQEHMIRNQMDIEKKAREEMNKADIRATRDLQQMRIVMGEGGQPILMKERFGRPIKGALPLANFSAERVFLINNPERWVFRLSFTFLSSRERAVCIWIPGERIGDEVFVKKAFARCGVSLGFSRVKENEILAQIVLKAVNEAKDIEVPRILGWYSVGNNVDYAMDMKACWKGMEKWM